MSEVRHVAIVGRDIAAWLTALALRRALGAAGVRVSVVELPSLLTGADVVSALPALGGLHKMIGLSEGELLPRTAGVPVLGQRFAGWSGQGSAFLLGYDTRRPTIGDIDFLQFWVMARARGMRVPWEDFSLAAAAAKQGRVPPLGQDQPDAATGYHLDARSYAALIRAAALQQGVAGWRSAAPAIDRAGDCIRAVVLEDGTRVEADFFVDATGAEALLLGTQPGAAWESWSELYPTNRLFAASAPKLDPLPAFAHLGAFQAGWLGMFPLQDRTAILGAYDDRLIGDEQMARTAAAVVGQGLREAVATPFRPGIQRRMWIGNCMAVGDAAAQLEPMDGVHPHLTHLGISALIAHFPFVNEMTLEARVTHDFCVAQIVACRDFQLAHYHLNRRTGEPLWDKARARVTPALDTRRALFAARGEVPPLDNETFEPQNWAALFLGHGLIPRDHHPLPDQLPEADAMAKFQALLHLIAEQVRAMPSLSDYLHPARTPARRGLY